MSFYSRFMYALMTVADKKLMKQYSVPEDISMLTDIPYGTDKKWEILDIYRPKGTENKAIPVLVNVHGGGWIYGNKEIYKYYCMHMAEKGYAVISFNYPLPPKVAAPSILQHTVDVFKWVATNAAKYHFDIKNLFGMGDSAGAHTLAQYGVLVTNPDYEQFIGISGVGCPKPNAILLNSGVYDFFHLDKECEKLISGMVSAYCKQKFDDSARKKMTMVDFVNGQFPPAFIMTAVADFTRNQPKYLSTKLQECGNEYVSKEYGSDDNKLGHIFNRSIETSDAVICNNEEADFLNKHVR